MSAPSILFRCDGGATQGMGHVARCVALARTLLEIEPGARIAFWGSFDDFARSLCTRFGIAVLAESPAAYSLGDCQRAREICARYDHVVIDSYELDQDHLDAMVAESFRLVVIDDLQQLDLSRADLVVCFRAGAEAFDYRTPRQALGVKYLIVKPELRHLRQALLGASLRRPRRLLIFVSASSRGSSYVAELARCLRLPGVDVTYVGHNAGLVKSVPGVTAVELQPDVEKIMAQSDFIVCGGGLVKYESAYLGVPNACLSQTDLQLEDTRRAEKLGITFDLGSASEFDPLSIRDRVSGIFASPGSMAAQREACREVLDTDSTLNLAKLLLSV